MADNKKTAARRVRGGGLDEKKPALKSRLFECGRRERITRTFDAALRAVAKATLSRFARLKPPSEVLILLNSGRKKTCFKKQVFSNVVGERGLRASSMPPCGPLLKQRCLASLGSNLLRRFSSS